MTVACVVSLKKFNYLRFLSSDVQPAPTLCVVPMSLCIRRNRRLEELNVFVVVSAGFSSFSATVDIVPTT